MKQLKIFIKLVPSILLSIIFCGSAVAFGEQSGIGENDAYNSIPNGSQILLLAPIEVVPNSTFVLLDRGQVSKLISIEQVPTGHESCVVTMKEPLPEERILKKRALEMGNISTAADGPANDEGLNGVALHIEINKDPWVHSIHCYYPYGVVITVNRLIRVLRENYMVIKMPLPDEG